MLGFGKKWDPPSSIYRLVNVLHCTLQNNLKVRSKHVICQYFNNASFFGNFLKTPINTYHKNDILFTEFEAEKVLKVPMIRKIKLNCVYTIIEQEWKKINHFSKYTQNLLPMAYNIKLLTGFDYKTLFEFFISKVKFYRWFFSLTRKFCCWVKILTLLKPWHFHM